MTNWEFLPGGADAFPIYPSDDAPNWMNIKTDIPDLETLTQNAPVLEKIMDYLHTYGHQGYSLDFVEPTQIEDPSALFTALQVCLMVVIGR